MVNIFTNRGSSLFGGGPKNVDTGSGYDPTVPLVDPSVDVPELRNTPIPTATPGSAPNVAPLTVPAVSPSGQAITDPTGQALNTTALSPVDPALIKEERERQAQKYSTPRHVPDFSSVENTRKTFDDAGVNRHLKRFQDTKKVVEDTYNDNTIGALTSYANQAQGNIQEGKGIYADDNVRGAVERSRQLTPENVGNYGSAVTVATLNGLAKIKQHEYSKQVAQEEKADNADEYVSAEEAADVDKDQSKARFRQAVRQPEKQPIMSALLNDINKTTKQALHPGQDANALATDEDLDASVAELNQQINDGLIKIGVNKHGQMVPLITEAGEVLSNNSGPLLAAYNLEFRQSYHKEPSVTSQPFPVVNHQYFGAQKIMGKDGRIKSKTGLTALSMAIQNNVGMSVHTGGYSILKQMAAIVEAGEVDTYNDTLEDVSTHGFAKNSVDRNGNVTPESQQNAKSVQDNNLRAIKKAVEKTIADRLTDGRPRYGLLQQSKATNRIFQTSQDINIGSHKGTLRMVTQFGNRKPATGVSKGMVDQTVTRATKVLSQNLGRGDQVAHTIKKHLDSMTESERQIVDTFYAIGKTLAGADSTIDATNWSPPDFIKYGHDNFNIAAQRGSQVNDWIENQSLPKTADNIPPWAHFLTEKGEWLYPVSIYSDAHKLHSAMAGGGPVNMDFQWVMESDARQSNAFLMSLTMGDPKVAHLLGMQMDDEIYWKGKTKPKSLRASLSDTLGEEIQQVFGKEGNGTEFQAMNTFVNQMKQTPGWEKIYGRGIVVAGLYGKTFWMMFKEINDMLNHKAVREHVPALKQAFGNDQQKLERAFAQLFNASANRHMGNLITFQTIMRGITDIKSSANGSSEIYTLSPDEPIPLGGSEVRGDFGDTQDQAIAIAAGKVPERRTTTFQDEDGPLEIGQVQREDTLAVRKGRTHEGKERTYGESAKNTAPPSVIQSYDSLMIALTSLFMNNDGSGEVGIPKNLFTIHDALITGPGSTMQALNAYNNFAPHFVAKNGKTFFHSLQDSMNTDLKNSIEKVKEDGGAIIGEQGEFRAMMGAFDRIYDMAQGDFHTQDQIDRGAGIGNTAKSADKQKQALAAAVENGYLPPTKMHEGNREWLEVSPEQYKNLLDILIEFKGLASWDTPKFLMKGPHGNHSINWLRNNINKVTGVKNIKGSADSLAEQMAKTKGGWINNLT